MQRVSPTAPNDYLHLGLLATQCTTYCESARAQPAALAIPWHPNPNDRTGRILVSRRSPSLCVQPPNLVSCLDSQGLHPRQSPSNAHLYRTSPAACLSLVRSARGCPRGTGAFVSSFADSASCLHLTLSQTGRLAAASRAGLRREEEDIPLSSTAFAFAPRTASHRPATVGLYESWNSGRLAVGAGAARSDADSWTLWLLSRDACSAILNPYASEVRVFVQPDALDAWTCVLIFFVVRRWIEAATVSCLTTVSP
ncbi:hypothetical protein B0H10DRAFT_407207 [Mycena sp. CBHHK59/15]|nr:hypothetical protein B0H10DRAFT_407207 [Mycena sp. CBHHK59/15]